MKGVIFNVVEDAVVAGRGDDAWDAVLERSGLDGSWTAIGDYDDAELLALVEATAGMLGLDADELTRRLGHDALLGLAERYPAFLAPHAETIPFLLTLNDVIHPEVRKLHPTARPPRFAFERTGERELVVVYESHRTLCRLADGMIRGAATRYGEVAQVVHEACTRDGAPHCRLRCTFAPAGDAVGRGPHRELAAR